MVRMFWIATVLFATIHPGQAEFVLMGVGTQTCGQFVALYQMVPKDAERTFFGWAQGFMSGANMVRMASGEAIQDLSSMSVEDQQRALRSYCEAHPLTEYMTGVTDLYWRLSPGKVQKK